MSLLLDALKRAEQEKSARGAQGTEGAPSPRSAAAGAATLELQPMAGAVPANSPHVGRAGEAHGAQALFEAKAGARAGDERGRGPLLAAIGAIAVIVLAAGAYVWYSVSALTPRAPAAALPLRPPAAPTPPAAGPSAAEVAAAPAPAVAAASAPPAPAAATVAPVPGRDPAAGERDPATAQAAQRRVLDLLREPVAAAPASSTAAAAEEPVQLSRSAEPPAIPRDVAAGYDELHRGDLDAARRSYTAALAADPANVDALLGLATIDGRMGRASAAAARYRRALQLDPRNATALAGLAALADWSRPDELETQLRSDLARTPQSAPLHSALGNLYAAQGRWTEAQAAYFEAHRLQPGSADTTYNLAVSLDRLGETRLAVEYYARALDASRGQAAQFDAAAVQRRLAELR